MSCLSLDKGFDAAVLGCKGRGKHRQVTTLEGQVAVKINIETRRYRETMSNISLLVQANPFGYHSVQDAVFNTLYRLTQDQCYEIPRADVNSMYLMVGTSG